MKKYKEDAYKGYMKFVKETYRDDFKIASITWISMTNLKVEIEAPCIISTDKENKQHYHYRFCPKTYCVIDFSDETTRKYAKQVVYSALWRMNKELEEIGEKVEGK